MEKYVKVATKSEDKAALPNEIRVTGSGKVNAIIGYALKMLEEVRFYIAFLELMFLYRSRSMTRLF
jgi:hypothetical protein